MSEITVFSSGMCSIKDIDKNILIFDMSDKIYSLNSLLIFNVFFSGPNEVASIYTTNHYVLRTCIVQFQI